MAHEREKRCYVLSRVGEARRRRRRMVGSEGNQERDDLERENDLCLGALVDMRNGSQAIQTDVAVQTGEGGEKLPVCRHPQGCEECGRE
jgi:hypothetical protein